MDSQVMDSEVANSQIAKESEKTKRARKKLRKRLQKLEQEITQEALNRKINEIHDRISRYAANRVVLTKKSISLFDNNKNPAGVSNKVSLISQSIKENNAIFIDSLEKNEIKLKNHKINII